MCTSEASELELLLNQATIANASGIECFLMTLHSSRWGRGRALDGWAVPTSVYDRPSFSVLTSEQRLRA